MKCWRKVTFFLCNCWKSPSKSLPRQGNALPMKRMLLRNFDDIVKASFDKLTRRIERWNIAQRINSILSNFIATFTSFFFSIFTKFLLIFVIFSAFSVSRILTQCHKFLISGYRTFKIDSCWEHAMTKLDELIFRDNKNMEKLWISTKICQKHLSISQSVKKIVDKFNGSN